MVTTISVSPVMIAGQGRENFRGYLQHLPAARFYHFDAVFGEQAEPGAGGVQLEKLVVEFRHGPRSERFTF